MQLCKLFKCYSNHFLISLSISDLEILAKRVSVLYAVVHAQCFGDRLRLTTFIGTLDLVASSPKSMHVLSNCAICV